jgi:hypothetical protein
MKDEHGRTRIKKEEGGALHIEHIFGSKLPRIQATDALTGDVGRNTVATDAPQKA